MSWLIVCLSRVTASITFVHYLRTHFTIDEPLQYLTIIPRPAILDRVQNRAASVVYGDLLSPGRRDFLMICAHGTKQLDIPFDACDQFPMNTERF